MKYLILFLVVAGTKAFAYPEMTRHGYTQCISCHTTQVGGNLLTPYGRSLSRELLSQQTLGGKESAEGDEAFAYGLVQPPEWLTLGGDIRTLQMFVESKQASRGRFMIMQVDFDASAQWRGWRAFGSLGRIEPVDPDATAKDFVISPRHGMEYRFTPEDSDNRLTLRAGRFLPAYGINFPEHTYITRRLLDYTPNDPNPAMERYAGELSWSNQFVNVIATGILGHMEGEEFRADKGGTFQISTQVRDKSKFGLNYYTTDREPVGRDVFTRKMYGMFAHIAFSERWYGMLEVDRPQNQADKWGLTDLFKVGFEIHQGLHLLAIQEYGNADIKNPNPKEEAYSLGAQWFPRPHFDFYGIYRRERNTARSNDWQDVVWLIGHFYL